MSCITIPTLNEEKHIASGSPFFTGSTSWLRYEALAVDGDSEDQTTIIAKEHNAEVVVERASPEFPFGTLVLERERQLPPFSLRSFKKRSSVRVVKRSMDDDVSVFGKKIVGIAESLRFEKSEGKMK